MFCREMYPNSTIDPPCFSLAGFVLLSASQFPSGGIRLPDLELHDPLTIIRPVELTTSINYQRDDILFAFDKDSIPIVIVQP